ncbi:hypothetical protein QCE73_24945, partial [Caballeronia sp. LZ029]|nr:hypothetical protein [Caballeronia sp. LZ029]
DTPVAATPTSENDRAVPSITSDPHTEPLPTDAAGDGDHVASPHHENLSSAVATRRDGPVQRIESNTPAAFSAPVLSQPAVAISPPTDTAPSSTLGTTLDGLDGIAPIAEALLKTLAGKARTGRLDELKALELLRQAVLL